MSELELTSRSTFDAVDIRDPILRAAVEKHQSKPGSLQERKDEVQDDETLLDHLIKVTNGKCLVINTLQALRQPDSSPRSHCVERRDFEHLDSRSRYCK